MLVGCGKAESESARVEHSINGFVAAYNDEDFDKCTDYLTGVTDDATKLTAMANVQSVRQLGGEIEVNSIDSMSIQGKVATANWTITTNGVTATSAIALYKVDGKWKFVLGELLGIEG